MCRVFRPGLCSAASELSCVTVSSVSLGSVVTAVVHPVALQQPQPPPVAVKLHSQDDIVQSSSPELTDSETSSHLTEHTTEPAVSMMLLLLFIMKTVHRGRIIETILLNQYILICTKNDQQHSVLLSIHTSF